MGVYVVACILQTLHGDTVVVHFYALHPVRRCVKYKRLQVYLIDPPGSALYNKVECGVLYAPEQAERTLRRNRSVSACR